MSAPLEKILSSWERGAVWAIILPGLLSGPSTFGLFVWLLRRVHINRRAGRPVVPIALFYIAVLFWDTVEAVSNMINIRWSHDGRIATGNTCFAQAVLDQLGSTGISLSIMGMSWCILHDFVLDIRPQARPVRLSLSAGYLGLLAITLVQVGNLVIPNAILHGADNYYGISAYWCFISDHHLTTKWVTHYMWLWLSALVSFLATVSYCFCGYYGHNRNYRVGLVSIYPQNVRPILSLSFLTVNLPNHTVTVLLPFPFQVLERPPSRNAAVAPLNANEDRWRYFNLLWFPISYICLILPLSVVRWRGFKASHVSKASLIGVASVWAFNGLVDFALWYLVKPQFVSLQDEAGRGAQANQANNRANQANGGPANQANGGPANQANGGPAAPNEPPMELPEFQRGNA